MMSKCQGCGVEKDRLVLEASPYAAEDRLCDEPMDPLFDLDCVDELGVWKQVTVCHQCFHKLDPDMWISRNCWEKLNPVVAFVDLPPLT